MCASFLDTNILIISASRSAPAMRSSIDSLAWRQWSSLRTCSVEGTWKRTSRTLAKPESLRSSLCGLLINNIVSRVRFSFNEFRLTRTIMFWRCAEAESDYLVTKIYVLLPLVRHGGARIITARETTLLVLKQDGRSYWKSFRHYLDPPLGTRRSRLLIFRGAAPKPRESEHSQSPRYV